MKKIIILLFGVLLFTSCLKEKVPFQYTIRGTVKDKKTKIAIEGATVYLLETNENSQQTDNKGYYEFSGLEIIGVYDILVKYKPNDYGDGHGKVTLGDSAMNTVEIIYLQPF